MKSHRALRVKIKSQFYYMPHENSCCCIWKLFNFLTVGVCMYFSFDALHTIVIIPDFSWYLENEENIILSPTKRLLIFKSQNDYITIYSFFTWITSHPPQTRTIIAESITSFHKWDAWLEDRETINYSIGKTFRSMPFYMVICLFFSTCTTINVWFFSVHVHVQVYGHVAT